MLRRVRGCLLESVKSERLQHLSRVIDSSGAPFSWDLPTNQQGSRVSLVTKAISRKQNVIFCGCHGTGKLTMLREVADKLISENNSVALVSADSMRATRLGGIVLHHFLGLRSAEDLPGKEQMSGTLERHVRLMDSTYENIFPSIATADVLLLDSLHLVSSLMLASLDETCRRIRSAPNSPFGGRIIIATADFWRMRVTPGSDVGGYIFQMPNWNELFPKQIYLNEIYGQSPDLAALQQRAHFGSLTASDIKLLPKYEDPRFVPMVDNTKGFWSFMPRFPKQAAIRIPPGKVHLLRKTEFGAYLNSVLGHAAMTASLGLCNRLSLDPGSRVHVLYDINSRIPTGTPAEVTHVHEHFLTLKADESGESFPVPRAKVSVFHPDYPEIAYQVLQFPVMPRSVTIPMNIINYGNTWGVAMNGLDMADTNDIGNLLSRMRTFDDFCLKNVEEAMRVEGIIHEPTRIYLSTLAKVCLPGSQQWCKNCKNHVDNEAFYAHWKECVATVRWCGECNVAIPLEKHGPHMEKHQIVLCIDCGSAVEWRHWENHRLSCAPMMREITTENEFLPEHTRRLSLELGLDKRELHKMKSIGKTALPKSRKAVTQKLANRR